MEMSFKELLPYMSLEELTALRRDLARGGLKTRKMIDEEILIMLSKQEKCCLVCSSTIKNFGEHNFSLEFGPDDLKRKVHFCALDCMTYFIEHMKSHEETQSPATKKRLMEKV
jgi:hypothetical protein